MLGYGNSVFLNCPFDAEYKEIFDSILFTVQRCGFTFRCSKEFDDNSTIRINNIIKLIKECQYSIHDISKVGLDDDSGLPRFNMPFELGIAIGAQRFGDKKQGNKEFLILESQKHRFKVFVSDLAGSDINHHNDEISKVVKVVRDWLSSKTTNNIPSGSIVLREFKKFQKNLPNLCRNYNWLENELTYREYLTLVITWIEFNTELN